MSTRKRRSTSDYPPAKRGKYSRALAPRPRWIPRLYDREEFKFLDTTVSSDMNTTAILLLLNGMQYGNTAITRIGMKINIKSLEMRLLLRPTVTTGVENHCRWTLILDRQPNGAAPAAVTDILTAQSNTGMHNLANRKRFKILRDQSFTLGSVVAGASTGMPTARNEHVYIKFRKGLVTEYNTGNAGTVADISTNSLYLMYFGSEVAGNTDVACNGLVRIRYTDN